MQASVALEPSAGVANGVATSTCQTAASLAERRAAALAAAGAHIEALAMCDDGLTFSPKHVGLLRLRAEVLMGLRHFAESAAGYRAALVQAFDAHAALFCERSS